MVGAGGGWDVDVGGWMHIAPGGCGWAGGCVGLNRAR